MILTEIETGLRWGELIALRPQDIDFLRRVIAMERIIVEGSRKISPTGKRIVIKAYTSGRATDPAEHFPHSNLASCIASKRRLVITPEQFELIYANLPTRELRLFVENRCRNRAALGWSC